VELSFSSKMVAERLFQCLNRLTIQCNNDRVRHNPNRPKATFMKLGCKCSKKRLIFFPYEGSRPLNTSFSANHTLILCSNIGITSTHRFLLHYFLWHSFGSVNLIVHMK
jgi:hypothetical protein